MSRGSIVTSQVIAMDPLATLREAVAEPTFVAGLAWGMTSLVVVVPAR
jgi:hypothetical protein